MFEVLVIYRWASLGGVERMLLNRAHAFKEYGRRVRFNVLFLEDVGGGKQALREYVRCHELEHQFRLVENIHEISPDLTLAIDTPEAFSMIPADWPLILECHTAYEKNRQYLSHLSSAPHNILALWVPTTTFARRLALEFPDLGRLIDVVPNSLAAPGADLPQEAHRYPGIPVLYLGRVDTLKNVVDVVRIVARARTLSGQDFRLLIIGDVYDDRLLPTITEEAMDYFVATLPSVEFHQTTFILQQVRRQQGVFVSASRGETFGLAAAEAMAHRLPVLLSDIPEHRTLVRDNEHLLFEQGDQQAAAEKLCWLAGDNWPAASAWVHVCAGGITSEAFIDAWDRAMKTVGFEVGFPVAPKRPVTQSAMLDLWPLLTRQIQEMHTTRQERDALAQQRDEVASQRDGYATALEQTLAQMEISHRLNADITASYSWRVTAPIRFVLRFIRHGFLAEDRRWFEAVLRRVFHHLPLSFAQKEKLFHWYGRHFGYPLAAPGQDTQAKVRNAAEPPPLPGGPSQTSNAGNEFIAPDHWDHRHTPYGVLCLPIIDWNFRFQRPQQLARRFAVTGHPVSYASLRFGPDLAVTDLETGVRGLTLPGSESTNVYQEMPTEADVTRLAESLRRYMTAHPGHPWVCVVQLPYWGPVAERLRQQTGCYVVYDCMDDHSGFSTNGEAMLAAENHLLRSADLVVASSQTLFDKVAPLARQALMIRNAVDYPHFAAVPETHRASSASLTVGYYGAIADWFDSDLMAALAKSRPNWRLVLIGSTFSADIGPLEACQNIVLTGEKPYAELPLLIADWDCCVIPFKRLPLTEATNPVKVYEMLAAGKPVVAVSLPELRPIAAAGHIALADTSTAFAREIEQAVAENDSERQTARRRYAAENTWAIRQETLDKAIRELYPLVSIVIVTYNSLAFNRLCLESVFNDTDYPNYEIIVVDNASTDGTPEYLKGLQHPRLRVLLNEENRGFSAANNQGLALANGEYFCLLNNDTIVSGSWLSTLVGHLRAHPGLGLVGPVTNAIGNEARIPVGYCNLLDMPAWASAYCQAHRDRLEDISMLAFFCVAMPRAVFETVGPLDERFGIGMFEDDDYNRRVREAGFQIKLAQDAYIHHWQCASFKILGEDAYFATYYENEKKYRAKWAMNALDGAGAQKLAGLVEASKSAPGTLIFAPSIGWDIHLFQRPHHLAKVMAQDGYTVIFDCSNSLDDVALLQEVEPRLFLFKGEPELLWGLHNPVLWTFPYNYDYRDRFPSDIAVIYDWIDDLSVFPYDQEMLAKLHARAMKEATLVACVARRLHDMALAERPDVLYLPNAVEEGRFDHPPTPNPALSDKAFARIVASGKPIAGYYGALARWFDYELLAQVAELRPDWHFVLIGPDHDGTIGLSSMAGHDNITWLGPRDYQALPGYLHRFDVAMIPFKINDITLATSPLKLFEYFAGGRPVVTTPMPECMAFSEVRIGSDANTFSAALDQARNDGKSPDFQAHLLALSYENTWRARARAALVGLASRNAEGATNAGVGMQPTLDQLHQVEQALSNNLPSVPEPVRGRVADVVGDYTRRAKTARRKTLEEQTDFLLTYGASFWKILARKKTGLDQIKSDRPIPALFSGWKHIAGQCNICGQQTRFFYRDPALYRESLTCEHCRSTSRYRSIARGLLDAIKAVAGVEAPSLSQLPRTGVNPPIRLYDTQPPFHYEPCAYPIPEYLGLCDWIELHLSSYKPDLPLGTMLSQTIANQNLERLTYPDAYFDIVITSDVMEHVRLDDKAHGEIARVLKPGGIYLFTVPHNWEWERNLIRVRVDDPGRLENDVHVLPPEYHGDANGDGTGILAFRAYGRELAEQLAAGGLTLNYEKTDLPGQGILNTELFYCEKSAKPESCAAGNPMHGRMAAALPAIQPGARPRIIIHAGAPKTGTTLIQVYLLNYFRHDDYFYLNPDIINNSGFLDRVHGLHDRTVDVLELAKSAGWKAGQTLVISHEALLGYGELLSIAHQHYFYGAIHDNARRLKTLLTDCDIEVVYYVRRQDEFIVSFYLEHIAYCYRDTKINFDDFISVQEPEKMSWLSRLNELVDVFGEEHVRFGLFDEIKAGPSAYVANFMRRIGVDVAEKDIPDLGRERPSLSAEAYELAMTAQKLTLDDAAEDKLFELLRTHFSNRTHHKADLLSTERRAWLMSLCEADNVAMFEKYFPDQPPRLWHVSKTMRVAHVLEN